MAKEQAKHRSHPDRAAYQLTHDDIAEGMRQYVSVQLSKLLDTRYTTCRNPIVNWVRLQTALMVIAAFGSGSRGAEMLSIRISDLRFFGETIDSPVGAMAYTKSKNGRTELKKVLFPSWTETSVINPALCIYLQLLFIHGTGPYEKSKINGPLFPSIVNNEVQHGKRLPSDSYRTHVRDLFSELGVATNASEHSPKRGGSGFRFYVLGEQISYIRDVVGHKRTKDTLRYIGLYDDRNSYIEQGYGTCASGIR